MMIEPKITMMSYRDTQLSGRVVLNGHEWVVEPFEVASDASPKDKENKLIERAVSEWRTRLDARESRLMD